MSTISEIDNFIENNPLACLFISRKNCSVCQSLLPQVEDMLQHYPSIKLAHIDADETEAVAGQFFIFTVPVLLLFVEGREYIREARIVHMDLLEEKVQKIYQHMG